MPQQIKRTDLGTGPFVEVKEEVVGEEIPTNFLGDEIPEAQWKEDDEGNVIISPALSYPTGEGLGGLEGRWVGEEITRDGLPKYKDGIFTYEGFREWEDLEREEGRDGFWHWLTVTLPEGSKEAFNYLYEGAKEMPDKFKEDPMKAMAIFPEAALAGGEGWVDIASGAVDLAKRPFRPPHLDAEARYERYKKFAERTKRIMEERKSRVGDAIRAYGFLTDTDLRDYASAYDEGINPASADSLSMIVSPDALFGGSLYRTGTRLAGKPAAQANKALNNAIKGVNQGTGRKLLNAAKEVMKRPVTTTTEGVGKAAAGLGKGIETVGEKISALSAPGRVGENFPQLVKAAGETVKLPGTALKGKGQIVSVIGEAARKGGRRQTGLSVVKKKGDLVKPLQKFVELVDKPISDRILRNAGDLADKAAKGFVLGVGLGGVAGGKEGAAAGGGMGLFGGGMGFAGEKAAKYAPFIRNKFKGAERLKLDEEFVTEYAATLSDAERKAFLNPDRRMSVSELAAEADAAQLFQGFQRKTGQNIDIKYVDGDGMVKAATSDPSNPNHNARYQYGAFVPKWDSGGKLISRTIYINTDVSGSSRNRTLFHELFHPTEYFAAPKGKKKGTVSAKLDALKGRPSWEAVDPFKDIRAELEQALFGTFDSAGNRRSDGIYTEKQMLDFENQYLDAVYQLTPGSPQGRRIAEARRIREKAITEGDLDTANKASFAINELQKQRQSNIRAKENYLKGDTARRRKNITSEILSENFANFGEKAHFGLLREAKKTLQKNKFKGSSLNHRMARLGLSTLGKMRQVLAGKGVTFDAGGKPKGDIEATSSIFIDPLTGERLVNSPETEHLLAQYIVALEEYNQRLAMDTESSVDLFENAKDFKEKGRDGLTPEKERQLREVGWLEGIDSSGIPVFSTARQRNKWHKENVAKVIDTLNANPEDEGEPKMWRKVKTKKGRDRWEGGVPSEKQMEALRNSDIDPSYVRKIEMIRNAILEGDGTIFGNDYYKALTGGKYDSRASVKFRLMVPFALEATQAGNINIKSFNVSKLENKINDWQTRRPKFFEEWGGDTDAFRRDVIDFFQGPSRGKKFPEGKKKDLIYQFMQIGNQRNPLSGEFVEKSGGMIESNRIERSTNLQPLDNLDKIPFDYWMMLEKQYMPAPSDASYNSAVKSGDTQTAQRLVNEAARSAGYTVGAVYHGTADQFSKFRKGEGGKVTDAKSSKLAFFFTDDPATAKAYSIHAAEEGPIKKLLAEADRAEKRGDWDGYNKAIREAEKIDTADARFDRRKNAKVINAYLKGDFAEVDAGGKTPAELAGGDIDAGLTKEIQKAKREGKDGVKFINLDDAVGMYDRPSNHFAVFDPSLIKSADPITRDDAGNVIPLSQRFSPESPDIRFMPAGNEKAFSSAKRTHGLTRNIEEAGYVLPDGSLLDFSGRHQTGEYELADGYWKLKPKLIRRGQPDYQKGQRIVDHREIEYEGVPEGEQWSGMVDFMKRGAVRIDAKAGMISVHGRAPLTKAQESRIKEISDLKDGEIYLDAEDDAGKRMSVNYDVSNSKRIIGDLKRWARSDEPESGDRFMPAPTFYSKAERAVEASQQKTMSVDQAVSLATKGIPKAEYEWSGVVDWLEGRKEEGAAEVKAAKKDLKNLSPEASKAQREVLEFGLIEAEAQAAGKVSKAELLEFLQNKGVKVEEVYRGGRPAEPFDVSVNMEEGGVRPDDLDPETRMYSVEASSSGAPLSLANYGYYSVFHDQDAGNVSVKRDDGTWIATDVFDPLNEQYLDTARRAIKADMKRRFHKPESTIPEGAEGPTLFNPDEQGTQQWVMLPGDEKARQSYGELVLTLPKDRAKSHETFELPSGHRFPESNILAHIRFTERVDADGKKMLFLEELQSDWSGEGRDRGWAKERPPKVQEEILRLRDERNRFHDVRKEDVPDRGFWWKGEPREYNPKEFDRLDTRIKELEKKYPHRRGVPDMPFKGDNRYGALAMKRMIRWAADNGFERLGWITGKDTAERYNLQKQVSSITLVNYGTEGQKKLLVHNKAADLVLAEEISNHRPEADLERYLGKNLAKRLLEQPPASDQSVTPGARFLEGDDLAIGGEWAETLYDKVLPTQAKKIVKKKGAVGRTRLGEGAEGKKGKQLDQSINQIEDELRQRTDALESVRKEKASESERTLEEWQNLDNDIRYLNREILSGKNELKELRAQKEGLKSPEANYVDITPEVKALAEEGFSYFMPAGVGRGRATVPAQPTAPTLPATPIMPRVKLTEEEKEDSRRLLNLLKKEGI